MPLRAKICSEGSVGAAAESKSTREAFVHSTRLVGHSRTIVTFWGSRGMGSFFSLRNIADSKEVQSVQNFGERQVSIMNRTKSHVDISTLVCEAEAFALS